ncbi:MAG: hypothetical protein FJ145_17700 [Deltaproteobacteria bacterium]|nr:hypothetical protein [Deltaproteobacteria bacterium]
MNAYAKKLTSLARAYADGERAVIAAFFKKPRKPTDHVRWLKAQGFKEYSAIKPILDALAALYPKIGKGVERHAYAELTEKLADETKHAQLVMDLLQEITGKTVHPKDLTWLPEDKKLAKVRAKYSKSYATLLHGSGRVRSKEIHRKDENLERAAITLTEGGGGALYLVCSKLKKHGIEGKIAKVFHEILLDEVGHKDSGGNALASLLTDRESFERAAQIIGEVSNQRLRMRNEQFGFPLRARQLAVLDQNAQRSLPAR